MKKNSRRFVEPSVLRASVAAVVSCLALSAMPTQALAAGLGKVSVFSALGEPLRAEIEVNATAAELSGMRAQLASQDAFRQAGLDYASSLRGITFTLDRRPGGRAVIRLASSAPISEPLVDLLVELNWPTGRLVREYTFLLDPPEVAAKNARTPAATMAPAQAPVVRTSGRSVGASSSSAISEDTRARAIAAVQGQAQMQTRPASSQAAAPSVSVRTRNAGASAASAGGGSGETYVVKQGDTLRKIASETRPDGVTLEQMLIGLLRANQQAFGGGNMNRLRAGKILTIPDKSAVESITPREAKRIVATQTAEWYSYRNKLASIAAKSPVADSEAQQGVTGKITAKVEDKFPEAGESVDQVRVSGSGGGRAGKGRAGREDAIARDKALKEANERVAMLEQNVAKLQQLLELKDQSLADLQKQASAAKAGVTPAPVPPVDLPKAATDSSVSSATASVEMPKTAESTPASASMASETPTVAPATPEPSAPVTDAQPATPPAPPPSPAENPAPKARPTPPPPPPEPGFLETLLGDPMLLAGGGGILALLGGFLFLRRRRASKEGAQSLDPLSLSTPSISGGNLTANSVFRNSAGGQNVDTSHVSQTDFSQASPGSIDVEEVDPVAEADVYMAYGRDAQAEEILIEAKRKNPGRHAIDLKLLEIYADRKDMKQLDALAKELHMATGGQGPDWEKAVTLGQRIAPENPLFGGADAAPASAAATPKAQSVASPGASLQAAAATVAAMGGAVGSAVAMGSAGNAESAKPATPSVFETTLDMSSLDFDLGAGKADAAEQAAAAAARAQALDFSLDVPQETSAPQPAPAVKETLLTSSALDFKLPDSGSAAAPATPTPKASETEPMANDLEFDVDLTASTFLGNQMPRPDAPVAPGLSQVDMSSIDLNLEATQPIPTRVPAGSAAVAPELISAQLGKAGAGELSGANEDVSTKLDLAKAYEEMGDVDGARELLREVAKEGNSEQRERAKSLLTKLGN